MLKKLKRRFVLINMVTVIAMLLIIFSLVYHFTAADLERQSDDALQTLLQQGGETDPGSVPFPYFVVRVDQFSRYEAIGNIHYDLNDGDFIRSLLKTVYAQNRFSGEIAAYNLKYRVGDGLGLRYFAFLDVSGQRSSLRSLVAASFLIGTCSIVVFFGISLFLAQRSVKPVEQAWDQQKQFVSDASHELKTPLAVIMSNAELLQSPETAEGDREQYSRNILTMSRQMRSLVEGLLELSRVDNGQVKKSFQVLDFSALVENTMLPFEPVLYDKGMTLVCQAEPGILLSGSEDHLRQMIGTLLDNAGKYGSPGIVGVSLRRQGRNRCLLSVSNPGTPIPESELEAIFRRFYRSDKARSRDGSFGLGLSIARSIAEEHGGKIRAESDPTGNCFFITLPAIS